MNQTRRTASGPDARRLELLNHDKRRSRKGTRKNDGETTPKGRQNCQKNNGDIIPKTRTAARTKPHYNHAQKLQQETRNGTAASIQNAHRTTEGATDEETHAKQNKSPQRATDKTRTGKAPNGARTPASIRKDTEPNTKERQTRQNDKPGAPQRAETTESQ